MSERKATIRAFMEARHAESWPILNGLTQEDAQRVVYTHEDEAWTVQDLVAHLADAERGLLGQVQRLVAGEMTVPPDFDLDRWNRGAVRRREGVPVAELVQHIEEAYQEAIAFLESVDESDLDLRGRHAGGEVISAEEFFRRMADHRALHAADILQARSG